jgi:hypothetical protein
LQAGSRLRTLRAKLEEDNAIPSCAGTSKRRRSLGGRKRKLGAACDWRIARDGIRVLGRKSRSSDMVDVPEPVSACGASRQEQHFVQARFRPGEHVEIGKPERTYTVEPLEDPVPRELPTEPAESPVEPSPEEPIEPERARAP